MTDDTSSSGDRQEVPGRPSVLVLTTTLPATPGDGTPEFVLTLSQSLADRFRITILAPRVRGGARRESVGGVWIHRFPYFPKRWEGLAEGAILPNLRSNPWRWLEVPFLLASFLWHALRLSRRLRPAVVHAHWLVPAGLIALLMNRWRRIPYVVTLHGADAHALRGRLFGRLKESVIRSAQSAVPVSEEIAATHELPGGDGLIVPMGVDGHAIRGIVGERHPERGRFLFVGRLAEKKGVDVLIRSVARVPEASLTIIGDGPERSKLEALARELGVWDRVRFTGQLPNQDVFVEFRRAQALVIPSRISRDGDREGTPVVMGEGVAAGVPIISSEIGGLPEYIRHKETGLLVEPDSADALVGALREAFDHPDVLQSLAKRAASSVGESLDIRTTRDQYERILIHAAAASAG